MKLKYDSDEELDPIEEELEPLDLFDAELKLETNSLISS